MRAPRDQAIDIDGFDLNVSRIIANEHSDYATCNPVLKLLFTDILSIISHMFNGLGPVLYSDHGERRK